MVLSKVIHPSLLKAEVLLVSLLHYGTHAVSSTPPRGSACISFTVPPLLPSPCNSTFCADQLLTCQPSLRGVSCFLPEAPCMFTSPAKVAPALLGFPAPEASSAQARGCVITRDGLGEHRCWEREHQPCGCEPGDELVPSSSLSPLPQQNTGEKAARS